MAPCGALGCHNKTMTAAGCEDMCKATKGCEAYVFAAQTCNSGTAICWQKSHCNPLPTKQCRAIAQAKGSPARPAQPAEPAGPGADIPSKYALDVSAASTPLVAYPQPQMVRGAGPTIATLREVGDPSTWTNLNGLWEWEATANTGLPTGTWVGAPPFGKPLSGSILVPFPVESCLSGVAPNSSAAMVKSSSMWYRLTFNAKVTAGHATLLHFGAVDWRSTGFLNGQQIGNNTGGYNGFDYDITGGVKPSGNELLVFVFDPSDGGEQPNGKQRISAIDNPGGDTYTSSSGIWQTVWLEEAPADYIKDIKIDQASTTAVTVTVESTGSAPVTFTVMDAGKSVATASGTAGTKIGITVPSPKLWSTTSPHLYDLEVKVGADTVTAYFGLRTYKLGDGPKGKRPLLNGKFTFAAGFLDQSWWPDGQYTVPTDEGLAYDVAAVECKCQLFPIFFH